jgi:acetolactate synthase I/II/III large subunit
VSAPSPPTGGDLLARALRRHGVNTLFGVNGTFALPLFDAIVRDGSFRFVGSRTEMAAAFLADGYARATGRVGVCIVTTGPGALGTLPALGEAFADSSPVLVISAQMESGLIDRGRGAVHELLGQLDGFRNVTSVAERLDGSSITIGTCTAFAQMTSGRPTPGYLEIATDVLASPQACSTPSNDPCEEHRVRHTVPVDELRIAAQTLSECRRALIWAGGGVIRSSAWTQLAAVAEALQAPVMTTWMGKGAIPGSHRLCVGAIGTQPEGMALLREADVLLAVGTRFKQQPTADWTMPVPRRMVHIDIDRDAIGRTYPVDLGLVGDAGDVLEGLARELADGRRRSPEPSWGPDRVARTRTELTTRLTERYPVEYDVVRRLRAAIPDAVPVVCDLNALGYWLRLFFEVEEGGTFIYPDGFYALGSGLPTALGVKAGRPDRPVVVVTGDGGFAYACFELTVSIQHELPLIVVLVNDNAFGAIRAGQRGRYGGREIGVQLVNPSFAKLAHLFGYHGVEAKDAVALEATVRDALHAGGPWLIEFTAPLGFAGIAPVRRATS